VAAVAAGAVAGVVEHERQSWVGPVAGSRRRRVPDSCPGARRGSEFPDHRSQEVGHSMNRHDSEQPVIRRYNVGSR